MNRVLAAARLHLVHPLVVLGVPWMVGAVSFAINWAVWRIVDIRSLEGDDGFTGGVSALYITVLIVFVQAVTQLMPFAMGISLSRRSYFLGTCLAGVGMALGFGVALALLDAVESATGAGEWVCNSGRRRPWTSTASPPRSWSPALRCWPSSRRAWGWAW